MEVRFFKKSERQLLLESIDRLWRHDHVYVRKPEVLEHLVLHTPYRAAFAGEENYSVLGIWDEGTVVGLRGIVPQKLNFLGQDYESATSTMWVTDSQWKNRVDGLSLRRYVLEHHLGMDLTLGLSEMSLALYRPFGYDLIEKLPRWVCIVDMEGARKVLLQPSMELSILPQARGSTKNNTYSLVKDALDGDKWDLYYKERFAPYTIGTKRDYDFLHWRYGESPVLKYHNIAAVDQEGNYQGLAIFRLEPVLDGQYFIGRILEFMALDMEVSLTLANGILAFAPQALMWDFYSLSGTTTYGLEMVGFARIPDWCGKALLPTRFQPIDYKTMDINGAIYLDKKVRRKMSVLNNCPWYITRGDGDQDRAN